MPTDKKRVNLSIPDNVYDRLQAYRIKNGISSDAGACLQLIIRQLDSLENAERMMQMVSRFSVDELQQFSNLGVATMKTMLETHKENNKE